jgi:hypothetical protein
LWLTSVASAQEILTDPGFEDTQPLNGSGAPWREPLFANPIPDVNATVEPRTGLEHAVITYDSNQSGQFGPTIGSSGFAGFGAAKNVSDFTGITLDISGFFKVVSNDMVSPDPAADPSILVRMYLSYYSDTFGFLGFGGFENENFVADTFVVGSHPDYVRHSYQIEVADFGTPVTSVEYTLGLVAPNTDLGIMTGTATVYFDDVSMAFVGNVDGDFNMDGIWDCADIDDLVGAAAAGNTDLSFDMNGDGQITLADITDPEVGWLAVGGANNPSATGGNPFLVGDATLDGTVDGLDFIEWNTNKFTNLAEWCGGDFTADGTVDGLDFIEWNTNKFQSSDRHSVAVPEPSSTPVCLVFVTAWVAIVLRKGWT